MQDTPELLRRLLTAGFDMLVVGGVAAVAHGSARFTQDLDVFAPLSAINMRRLHEALEGTDPRHHPGEEALRPPADLATFRNVYVRCTLGRLDVLGDLGTQPYVDLLARAVRIPLFGRTCSVLGLSDLIAAKLAAGRNKDLEAVIELRALADRLRDDSA